MSADWVLPVAVAAWAVSETALAVFRRRVSAGGGDDDRGSLALVFSACGVGTATGFVLQGRHVWPVAGWPVVGNLVAVVLMLFGVVLRWAAIRTLGRQFSVRVVIQTGHELVRHGPYRWLRHPSYSGILLILAGIGIAQGDLAALAATVAIPLAALLYRIHVEEQALARAFGAAWRDHCAATWRLVPWLF